MTTGQMFLIVCVSLIAPLVVGALIAQALKMKEYGTKIGVSLLALVLALTPFITQLSSGKSLIDMFQLGIDLAGGTNLVYEVDSIAAEAAGKEINKDSMDRLVGAVNKRLNPSGTEQITVRQVGKDRIEVIIPGADPEAVARQKRNMTRLGSLEFALLANQLDHADIIARAQEDPSQKDIREEGNLIAGWREVAYVTRSDKEKKDNPDAKPVQKEVTEGGRVVTRMNEEGYKEFLVIFAPEKDRVTGQYLTSAYQTNSDDGSMAVGFRFNARGGKLFGDLTSSNPPLGDGFARRLAVLLDGHVESAPSIQATITTSGVIEGRFTAAEIKELITVLNAGALEVPLNQTPVSEFTVSPTLGVDIQEKGKTALIGASIVVVLFMIFYYFGAGLVADFCLLMNLILVLGCMVIINATFTLPGLAGLVLTIGMAVDANVLIFERIREEKRKGSSLRLAIHNGFDRAFTTIVDANVTTLLTAILLYMIGTDQVKGFAVTLFIGIVMSMFTSLYVGRMIFEILEQKGIIKDLKMNSFGKPKEINFVGKQKVAGIFSVVLIVAGIIMFGSRGEDNLDIDFSGGTMVSFKVENKTDIDQIRKILKETDLGNSISVDELTLGEQQEMFYRLRTKETNVEKVQQVVNQSLTDAGLELRKITLDQYAEPTVIPEEGTDEFAGGQTTSLTFSNELTTTTVADGVAQALELLNDDNGEKKFSDPTALVEVLGLEGSGLEAEEGQAKRFSVVKINTRPSVSGEDLNSALASMQQKMATEPSFEEVNSFGSAVASEMQTMAIIAIVASLIAIVAYIWFRFQHIDFGLAAVVALVHDVLVVVGMVAIGSLLGGSGLGPVLGLTDFRINLPMIAALLTVVGYSLNDTIVVFDRIREVRGKDPALTSGMVNTSLNQTLSRTLLTSLTTLIVVTILYIWGGEGIHGFAYCLLIGVLVGTYSSIFVASPVLLWLMNRQKTGSAA